jgi:CBS domain-containing protein
MTGADVQERLYCHTVVPGDPIELAAVLRTAGRTLLLDALSPPLDVRVGEGQRAHFVALQIGVGQSEVVGDTLRLPLWWSPVGDTPFCELAGAFSLDPNGHGIELAFTGQLLPAGLPADVLAAAKQTGHRLLRALAAELTRVAAAPPGPADLPASLRVRDVMTPEPLVVHADMTVRAATITLLRHDVTGAPVVDSAGRLVGVLSQSDLLVREAAPRVRHGVAERDERRRRLATTVGEACSRPALTIHPNTSLREAARLLLDADVGRLVVLEEGAVAGVLSRRDVLRALTRSPAQLAAAAGDRLRALGLDHVQADLSPSGQATLTGTVDRRSDAQAAARTVRAIDGITEVEDLVGWRTDDLADRQPALSG